MILTLLAQLTIFQVNPRTQAQVLSNKLIEGLISRHLCEVVDAGAGRLVSLHKLVKEGALVFSKDDTDDEKRLLTRSVLQQLLTEEYFTTYELHDLGIVCLQYKAVVITFLVVEQHIVLHRNCIAICLGFITYFDNRVGILVNWPCSHSL